MRRLQLVTYLGDNTTPIVADLARRLDWEVVSDGTLGPIERHEADVFWMCGLLTVELVDSGGLDAEIVAAPVFAGEAGPVYHSVIVTTSPATGVAELAGRRLVINEPGSWSGNHALRTHLDGAGVEFSSVVESGSHARSIDMLLAGEADVAAIDHTVWEHRLERDPMAHRLFVIERTRDWPAPPFSVSRSVDDIEAVQSALCAVTPTGLTSIEPAASADYDPIRRA